MACFNHYDNRLKGFFSQQINITTSNYMPHIKGHNPKLYTSVIKGKWNKDKIYKNTLKIGMNLNVSTHIMPSLYIVYLVMHGRHIKTIRAFPDFQNSN